MQILKVVLENIKSYRRAVIHLGQGTTAIRGHNGAGKSTLVEAIGFALFDFLPYTPASRFVREGEKLGKVVVTFVSAADERVYDVERRCATTGSGAWFVIDPDLHSRVAEGKDDTLDFLRVHLGMNTSLPLPDLFDNAIAVQQGTFTADFLQTAAVRKKKFDALLQVEEYRHAADALRDTTSYLKDHLAGHDKTIERLVAQTADLAAWRAERTELAQTTVALGEQIAQLVDERVAVEEQRDAALTLQTEVARLDQARERAHGIWQVAQTTLRAAQEEMARAQTAHEVCDRTRADFARHRQAQDALAQAQAEERAASALREQLARVTQDIAAQIQALHAAEERQAAAQRAASEAERLRPLVARQEELEQAQKDAEQARKLLAQAHKEAQQIATDLAAAQSDATATQQQIEQIAALEPVAALLEERRATVARLQQEAAQQTERAARRRTLAEQIQRQERRATDAAATLRAAEAQMQATRALAAQVADLPERETSVAALAQAISTVQADIAQSERSLQAAKGGMCPFLKEPCQNIKQRGMGSLADYFTAQINEQLETLHDHETQHEAEMVILQGQRAAQQQLDRLPEYETAATTARAAHADQHAELERLRADLAALETAAFDPHQHAAALKEAEALVRASAEADRSCAKLPTLRSQLTQATGRITALTERQQRNAATIATTEKQANGAETYSTQLRELGDPRRTHAVCEGQARQLPAIEAEIARYISSRTAAEAQQAEIQRQLAPYADLAERIAGLQATLRATATAHDDFLRHDAAARRLPEAQSQVQAAQEAADRAEADHTEAQRAHAALATRFDAAALAVAIERLNHLAAEISSAREQLKQSRQRANVLDTQIAEAEARLQELAAAQEQRTAADANLSLLAYCRDTIKEAGPHVMRALLREISAQANRIFGEIIGDRSAMLIWQEDYDIVLRAGAYERHFAQLSGGEQMSAALAVRLALLKTLTRATVAFFDEPTQNMDDERRANLASQIRRVSGFDQLVVISHDDTFEEGLDAVIWVRKNGGESAVESDPQAMLPAPILTFPTAIGA